MGVSSYNFILISPIEVFIETVVFELPVGVLQEMMKRKIKNIVGFLKKSIMYSEIG